MAAIVGCNDTIAPAGFGERIGQKCCEFPGIVPPPCCSEPGSIGAVAALPRLVIPRVERIVAAMRAVRDLVPLRHMGLAVAALAAEIARLLRRLA